MRKADLKGLEAERLADKLIWEVESCSEEAEKQFGRKGTLIHNIFFNPNCLTRGEF